MIDTLVVATHNEGKVAEFEKMLGGLIGSAIGEIRSANDFNLPEPEETANTFTGNALLKARAACKVVNMPCLADDSGLAVDALDGAPGIYSARWAETPNGRNFDVAMHRVYDECGGIIDGAPKDDSKPARFIAVLALVYPDGKEEVFEGAVEGHLTWPARGVKGFGYDPIFVPNGYDITFGQMSSDKKHEMSHRANAVAKFKEYLS